jgi:hypothetical protein
MLQTDTVAAIQTTVIREWADLFNWPALTATGLRVAGALVVAIIANYALKAVLRSVERSSEKDGIVTAQEQRTRTLLSLLRSVGRVVIWVMTLFMVLGALGLQLGPLLAGAGVVGLAVSFGAQSLVKDVISGLFILMENQFGVGDVVRLEGVSGAVERMTLRVVVLRDVHGVVHIVPNGEIKKVSNLTRGWARVVLDVASPTRKTPTGDGRDAGRGAQAVRGPAVAPADPGRGEGAGDRVVRRARRHHPHPGEDASAEAVGRRPRAPPPPQAPLRPGEDRGPLPLADDVLGRRAVPRRAGHARGRPRAPHRRSGRCGTLNTERDGDVGIVSWRNRAHRPVS